MSTRVTSTRLIGRERELAELEAVLADAAAGRATLAFVAGESGVGKSRLLSELIRRARAQGARVLSGDCVELGEGELPYAPIVGALRPLARAGDPVLDALGPRDRAALAGLLPGLGDGAPPTEGDESTAQARLFEALLTLLDLLGRDQPLLLVLEDLHWADRSTRAFVAFLSRSLCRERVLLVASYRSDELHRRHPLRPLLAELERDAGSRRIELARFTHDELAAQLADILGGAPDRGLVERLWTRGGGNPLFTEELLAAGLDGRGVLPATLRDALMVRVERLSEPAQEVLRLVAVGQRLGHDLLEETSGLGARELREALREAVAGHILVAEADGAHAFRHALLREVVEDDLLPGERTQLHRTLAQALEQRIAAGGAGAHLTAAVAHHFAAAGDRPAALAASVRAAAAARRVHAHGEAAALYERALELWDQVEAPEAVSGLDRFELLWHAARTADRAGETARHEALLGAALAAVDPEAEPRRAARILDMVARAERREGRTDAALAAVERGLALLPTGPCHERALLLGRLAKIRMLQSRFSEAEDAARSAIEAADGVDDPSVALTALSALGISEAARGDIEAGAATLRRALALARERDLPAELGDLYNNLGDVLSYAGQTREALAVVREGLAEPNLSLPGREWLSLTVGEMAFTAGDWKLAESSVALPRRRSRTEHVALNAAIRTAELALGHGDPEGAAAALGPAAGVATLLDEPQFIGVWSDLWAEIARRRGDLDSARAAVADGLDRIEYCSEDAPRIARLAAQGVIVEADAAERARDLGDLLAAATAHERALALLARVEAAAEGSGGPVEAAHLLVARVAAARAAGSADPATAEAAAAAWADIERPYPAAIAWWRAAEAHLARGDREAASVAAARAAEPARALGAAWLVAEVEGLAARARLALEPAGEPPPAPDPGAAGEPFGLTPRERQVLALVAAGATNREIGAELYMAEKTASVHVSRILAKLDVRTRTQAAAVAHRHGLDSLRVAQT